MPSQTLSAVLEIANSCPELKSKMLQYIDVEEETVDFEAIIENGYFGSGHTGAVLFAQAIWNRRVLPGKDPMPYAWSMDAAVMSAIVTALCIAWNIESRIENELGGRL